MQDDSREQTAVVTSASGNAAASAAVHAPPEAARAVTFEPDAFVIGPGRAGGSVFETYSWGVQRLPRHFDKAAADGAYIHHVAGTVRPVYPAGHPRAGQRLATQVLSFRFRSEAVFRNTGAHVAVILRSQSTATWNRGRGFILGHQNLPAGDPNACPVGGEGSAHVQPETWWTVTADGSQQARSFVWGPPFCSGPDLHDQRDYQVEIHVADGGLIEYWITDLEDQSQVTASLQDTVNQESDLVDGLTGYSLAMVFGSSQTALWRMRFYDIAAGWQ
ncbi:MAG: hypothetical protein KDH15_07180 [Rhodocyclaceae bacterium]|nr:hypothetical protein [Rhodocyclaceae bacterium]